MSITKLSSWRLKLHHFQALFRKRYQYAKRNKKGFVSAVIVPVIFICIAMLFAMAAIDESGKILTIYALLCNIGYYIM